MNSTRNNNKYRNSCVFPALSPLQTENTSEKNVQNSSDPSAATISTLQPLSFQLLVYQPIPTLKGGFVQASIVYVGAW
jgi:hypothetical protein